MTKNEFCKRMESLVREYCKENDEYDDIDEYYDYWSNGEHANYSVKLEIDRECFKDEEEEY